MYEKMLFGRKVLYFRYAPPLTRLDDVSDGELPNPPFTNAPPFKRSVFYYWWAFLKENADYVACCENGGNGPMSDLYRDFADVRGDDFMTWWSGGGRNLFCEPPTDQIETFLNLPTEHDNEGRVLLSIPITTDMERTLAELRQLLKPLHAKARRDGQRTTKARYPVHTKPVLTSLHQHLKVWQLKKAHPDWTNYQVAVEAGIGNTSPEDEECYDHRSPAASIVGRIHRQAAALIKNVGQGRFPDMSAA